ncbi:hypothetical protein FBUS_10496 [Fasciolopsis buskii]|uniref:Uncharacterized protein n=1 Tax=Fasciolopsis buskii TaxID=27845 RepID=A0A8E0VK16_9TREM|nr:hypothetical protein FBUS_10496 [Fasciolopsis buski]
MFAMHNLSDIGLNELESMHANVPINTQFPWKNTDVIREQSPARRPRETSLPRPVRHGLPRVSESCSRESSQDRHINKRKRALEQVASMSIRGTRRSTEIPSSPVMIHPMARRRHTTRPGDSTGGSLVDAIYATVRRRRELTGPIDNPLCIKNPGSGRAAGRRREILSTYDGTTIRPQQEQNPVDDFEPQQSSPSTPTNLSERSF